MLSSHRSEQDLQYWLGYQMVYHLQVTGAYTFLTRWAQKFCLPKVIETVSIISSHIVWNILYIYIIYTCFPFSFVRKQGQGQNLPKVYCDRSSIRTGLVWLINAVLYLTGKVDMHNVSSWSMCCVCKWPLEHTVWPEKYMLEPRLLAVRFHLSVFLG